MRHYIVDAHNLIHKDKELSKLLPEKLELARKRFLDLVNSFANRYPKFKISVVYDGVLKEVFSEKANVYIYEAGPYQKADDIIKKFIREEHKTKSCTIASSDLEIVDYARLHLCNYISAENFLYELKFAKAGKVRLRDIEGVKPVNLSDLGQTESESFLAYFEENPLDENYNPKPRETKPKKKVKYVAKAQPPVDLDTQDLINYFKTGTVNKETEKRLKESKITEEVVIKKINKNAYDVDDSELLAAFLKPD